VSRVYCTYFDHRYLAKGLAMIRSLRRHEQEAQVWVLCLSDQAKIILDDLVEPGVTAVALADFEAGDAELAKAKADGRSMVEYYFTVTPSLVRYVIDRIGAAMVTYLDGDLWFLAGPEPIYREMGEASILIIPHRFAPSQRHLEMHGIYNVGWNSFRNDERGRACLEWWRERNNEWCFDWVDDKHGRYCDQRYLDYFPGKFADVHVLRHRGANVAPWNVGASAITKRGGRIYSDDEEVLFFHFHGIKRLAARQFLTNHRSYRAPLGNIVRHDLYEPYLKELMTIEAELESQYGALEKNSARDLYDGGGSWWQRFKAAMRVRRAVLEGYSVTVPE
jgi:hypothetical protein